MNLMNLRFFVLFQRVSYTEVGSLSRFGLHWIASSMNFKVIVGFELDGYFKAEMDV